MKQQRSSGSQSSPSRLFYPQRSLLLTLLFLPAVGLQRFWELRSYTGGELALLTGRARPYSYRHTDRFLLRLSAAQADQALTDALARWTAAVWLVEERSPDAPSPHFYVDGHRKVVYSETLIPRGLIGRLGKIAGCRALVLLHDEQGHPRLSTTHRGDLHLTHGVPQILASFEQVIESKKLQHLVVDREAMAADWSSTTEERGAHPDDYSEARTNRADWLTSSTSARSCHSPWIVRERSCVKSLLHSFGLLVLIGKMSLCSCRSP
jgi:hypothetical protein